MREIRTSGSTRGSGRKALLRKRRLSLSTLPVPGYAGPKHHEKRRRLNLCENALASLSRE